MSTLTSDARNMSGDSTTTAFAVRTERWPELKEILADALEYESTRERLAFLQKACAGDSILLRETQHLLGRETEAFEAFAESASRSLHEDAEGIAVGQRMGAYRVVRELARGGMGTVYLAERVDGQFAKQVAIKVLKRGPDADEILRRFRIEREILARLEHPNITRLLDAGTTEAGLPYFIMEFVDGAPVTLFSRQHKLSSEERVALFLKICRAVDFAHRNGVVHRDIKPSNLLIGADGEPKLLDFGIAKVKQTAEQELTLTLPRHQRLTPKYASPEQRAGQAADASSDIYSLGAVLLELLTDNLLVEDGRSKPQLRTDFGRIITRAMAADPACRYRSATDFGRELEACLAPPNQRFASPRGRRFLALAAVVVTAAIVISWPLIRGRLERSASQTRLTSIAVLPFRGVGPEPTDVSLGLGMADAIITRLSGLQQLRVLPTTSVAVYQTGAQDAAAAGASLRVDAVLGGTVQRAGEKFRVTVQLVDVKSRRTLWAHTFDQTFTTIFEIQDAISENVSRSFTRELTSTEQKQIEKPATVNPAAYDAYTMGLYFWSKRTEAGLDKAVEYLDRATAIDAQFARAYALQADCYFLKSFFNYSPAREMVAKSRIAAERAIAIDPSLPEAHLSISTIEDWDGQPQKARESLRRALALNPNLAVAHQRYGWSLCELGKLDEALGEFRRAVELDPLSPTNNSALGGVLIFARQYPAALNYCARAVELEPANSVTLLNLGWIYQLLGRHDEALATYQRLGELDPNRAGDMLALRAAVLCGAGRKDEADALMPDVLKLAGERKINPHNLTLLYVARGEIDRAFDILEKIPFVSRTDTMLQFDPLLDPLRKDPRFAAIMAHPTGAAPRN